MTKEESLKITARIAKIIADCAPRISYTQKDLEASRASYGDEKLKRLKEEGYPTDDFEFFFAMLRFCDGMDLWKDADEEYLKKLFSEARKMDRADFLSDPYLSRIRVKEKSLGKILLTQAEYGRGEFFQYDMPCLSDEIVVPKIGFFTERVSFPAIYEGQIPWVSVCPSEIFSMAKDVPDARGRVLVLGLGLGYYPFLISQRDEVESITVVEKSPEIIRIFKEEILPQFPHKNKIRIVEADAFHFLEDTLPGRFDFCYADIWEGWVDGAACYQKILPHEKRLYDCEFRYWIRDEIRWYLKNKD